jgi:hypothetical protein
MQAGVRGTRGRCRAQAALHARPPGPHAIRSARPRPRPPPAAPQVQHNCNVLLIAIHGVAFCTDLALVRGTTPLVRGGGPLLTLGAPVSARTAGLFFPLRYVQWLHSTPTMLLLMALMSDLSSTQLRNAMAADVVTMTTGMVATWASGPLQRERRGRRRRRRRRLGLGGARGAAGAKQQGAWQCTHGCAPPAPS